MAKIHKNINNGNKLNTAFRVYINRPLTSMHTHTHTHTHTHKHTQYLQVTNITATDKCGNNLKQ